MVISLTNPTKQQFGFVREVIMLVCFWYGEMISYVRMFRLFLEPNICTPHTPNYTENRTHTQICHPPTTANRREPPLQHPIVGFDRTGTYQCLCVCESLHIVVGTLMGPKVFGTPVQEPANLMHVSLFSFCFSDCLCRAC